MSLITERQNGHSVLKCYFDQRDELNQKIQAEMLAERHELTAHGDRQRECLSVLTPSLDSLALVVLQSMQWCHDATVSKHCKCGVRVDVRARKVRRTIDKRTMDPKGYMAGEDAVDECGFGRWGLFLHPPPSSSSN